MRQWSDEDRCYACAQWGGGELQANIARQFGYKDASRTRAEIEHFIGAYTGSAITLPGAEMHPEARWRLAKEAIHAFLRARRRAVQH